MKILVLHGENVTESQKRLSDIVDKCKSKNWEILRPVSSDSRSIDESISNESLFNNKRLVIIEGAEKLSIKSLELINKKSEVSSSYILLYSVKEIGKSIIDKLPKETKVENFKVSKYLWSFVESFFPGNNKMALYLFHKTLEKDPPELVVAMLARQLGSLFLIKSGGIGKSMPAWKASKLSTQAKHFTLEKLKEIIFELSEIDYKSKTGKGDSVELLDMLLTTKLG